MVATRIFGKFSKKLGKEKRVTLFEEKLGKSIRNKNNVITGFSARKKSLAKKSE